MLWVALKRTIGGVAITIYRTVTVTGRNARFVPVVVSTTRPRKVIVQIVPLKGRKVLAAGRLTLKRKHGGRGTIRVKLPASLKSGSYYLLVRVTSLKGARLGKPARVKFALR